LYTVLRRAVSGCDLPRERLSASVNGWSTMYDPDQPRHKIQAWRPAAVVYHVAMVVDAAPVG
jgi:hypothetical protein